MILFEVAPGFKDTADTWQTIGGAVVAVGGAFIMIRKGAKAVARGFAKSFDAGVERTLKPALDEIHQAMSEGFHAVNERLDKGAEMIAKHTEQIARLEGIRDPNKRDRSTDHDS